MTTRRRSQRVAAQTAQLAIAVPQVVAHRVARMITAGPNPSARDRDEFTMMGLEKFAAFNESWVAMSAHLLKAQHSLWLSVLRTWSNPWTFMTPFWLGYADEAQRTAYDVLGSGLAPVHRRAVANARRLSAEPLTPTAAKQAAAAAAVAEAA